LCPVHCFDPLPFKSDWMAGAVEQIKNTLATL
jgi:hypothetical protein